MTTQADGAVNVQMDLVRAVGNAYKNYCVFEGRLAKHEYTLFRRFYLFSMLICFFSDWTVHPAEGFAGIFYPIWPLFFLVSFLPAHGGRVRRLHDVGMSGSYSLWYFTVVGAVLVGSWCARPGMIGSNAYGRDPLMADATPEAAAAPRRADAILTPAAASSPPNALETPSPAPGIIPPLVEPADAPLTAVPVSRGALRARPTHAGAPVDLDLLEKLAALHRSGVLTDAEFTRQKSLLFGQG
ncbi:MAG: DUF805 domain-containing protein [Caulobacteraceae bacterium]